MKPLYRNIKKVLWILVLLFTIMNVVAAFHAYKFTHFEDGKGVKTGPPKKLPALARIKTLLFGINNPRPANRQHPSQKYEVVRLRSNKEIECWSIKTAASKGTVIIFHGYSGAKSGMLAKSGWFLKQGFNVLLVDFMGSGGSEGNQTTIGYKESEEVRSAFSYVVEHGEKRVILFGTSMGAVAIMKAINDYALAPERIIIECPFGSLYQTTCARFKNMHVPAFPLAGFLVFWGGVENGFWAFNHVPAAYAGKIRCPTMLIYGAKDDRVSRGETDEIFANLDGPKELRVFPLAGHDNYWIKHKTEWQAEVGKFISAKN
ncbi:alpha/beta hydrolase [Hufsiella ginkgonis]|uniref:Prolyl oligopeptidase family serine peptidase n=1 Tax=Hufsiella ginkgonis TaxID=2695274 RepID=A0A7K1Y287_9SPHI|nr:alpha/beta fold hydrolase [Hufsiella ginkgonis]MXV17312.1 prolyl oligopeptidase family serine peptidase [Hufsiella ginkgonis]